MTISEIKAANKAAGYNFFDPGTMRYFRSKIERGVYDGPGGIYFITSEQFVSSQGVADQRKYSVRRFDRVHHYCNTVKEFNTITDIKEARRLARRMAGQS